MRQRQKILVLDVRLDFAIQAADQARFADALALIVKPADQRGIEPVLLIQAVADGPVARPHHHHARVGALVLVQPVELPVDKGAQKVAFAELDDALAVGRAGKVVTV